MSRCFSFQSVFFLIAIGAILCSMTAQTAEAHSYNYGAIKTDLTARGTSFLFETIIPDATPPEQLLSALFLPQDTGRDSLAPLDIYRLYFSLHLQIKQSGAPCTATLEAYDTTFTRFSGTYHCTNTITSIDTLSIDNTLFFDIYENSDNFVTLALPEQNRELTFTKKSHVYPEAFAPDRKSGEQGSLTIIQSIVKEFLVSGIKHIWFGYDHILFLLSVVLLIRSLRTTLILITSFTVAHSITLILAGFGIISLPASIVEPAIAFSIAVMSGWNILQLTGKPLPWMKNAEHWLIIFGFGLVHGLGFASALKETNIPEQVYIPALLIFNIGIELGQLALIALVLPLLRFIDTREWRKWLFLSLASFSLFCALFWFFQRISMQ